MKTKRAAALTVVGAIFLGLTGCDTHFFSSPLSVKRDGEHLLVAMCGDPVEVERIYASAQNRHEGIEWFRFWDANGRVSLNTGDIISFENEIEGLDIVLNRPPLLSGGTDLAITLVGVPVDDGMGTDFHISTDLLSEETWLHYDGSVTEEPCG